MKNSYPQFKSIQIRNVRHWQTGDLTELLIAGGKFVPELTGQAELVLDLSLIHI